MRKPALLASMLLFATMVVAAPMRKMLHEDWQFRQARLTNWYPATVPGVVHTDLLENGIIEDPFFRLNERGLQWIDKEDWEYKTQFVADGELLAQSHVEMVFEGLDTYADVYLNDTKLLSADNMFRSWRVDVKSFLQEGENTLRVYFHSPLKIDIPKWDALPFHYEASNDQSENGGVFDKRVSIFARKAGYHYGWDWGPRLVTSGIWRPVYLESWSDLRIKDVYIRQDNVTKKSAAITGEVQIESDAARQVTVRIADTQTGKKWIEKRTELKPGINTIELPFVIRRPRLWWSRGLGEAYRYAFCTSVSAENVLLDADTKEVGIRSLRVVNEPDEAGKSFYFELNGVPVFAKGANYIPQDNFLPRVTPEQYEQTILDAANANMNMLRVWGGGIYENELFYDLCDRYGIMVWQDFMFSCSLYPAEGALLENIRQEAIENVSRLRNHACIALWCGNNECQDAWFNWGWRRRYEKQNPAYAELIWNQFKKQYFEVLPEVVRMYAPNTFYWASSPFASYEGPSDGVNGDSHYWGVWHAEEPISQYNEVRSRFFSEYGFQAFPEFESVQRYAPEERDWNITSEVMKAHQRGGDAANGRIERYLLNEYRKPSDFRTFLYYNQVLQGDAIKTAIEAHRRDMPYCMGSLYWQHNDCWPVASWSSRDYYGRWKAQHYYARKAYRDVLVSPLVRQNRLEVTVVSDRLESASGKLEVKVCRMDGTELQKIERKINVAPNTSARVWEADWDALLQGVSASDVYVYAALTVGDACYDNVCYGLKQREMNYLPASVQTDIRPVEGGYEVAVQTDVFVRALFLETGDVESRFSDNFFDVLPGVPVSVVVSTTLDPDTFRKQLRLSSLNNTH